MSEREHAAAPVNTAFDPGCRRRRPRGSFAAASAVAPIARAPASAPTRNITTKKSGAAGDITIVRPTAAAPTRRRVRVSLQVEMRRAGFSATTRQGIKNTSAPAGNVGARARRSTSQHGFRSGVSAASTPWLVRGRIGGRSDRPRSSVGPDPEYHYKEIRRRRRHHHRAADRRCTDQAAGAGAHGFQEVLVKGFVEEVVILCRGEEIARHARSYGCLLYTSDAADEE